MRIMVLTVLAWPATVAAQDAVGNPTNGEQQFDRQCVSCHVVVDEAGETLAGNRARVGPNLYGVAERTPGTVDGFRYSDAMVTYGETGAVWEEVSFVAYVQDPTGFLRVALSDPAARVNMAYQVRNEQEAHDIWAYLASLTPVEAAPTE